MDQQMYTHRRPTPKLGMSGAKPLPRYMPSGRGQENLYLFTDIYLRIIKKIM